MKKILLYLTIYSLILLNLSCNEKYDSNTANSQAPSKSISDKSSADIKETGLINQNIIDNSGNPQDTQISTKIIRDGSISIKTTDLKDSKNKIDKLIKQYNAYYEREELDNNEYNTSYNLKVRVPISNFDKLIANMENSGFNIKSKTIQVRDVTNEYIDIESRLKNKQDYLTKYKDLLSKATNIKDIVEIENNIRTIQEEIESQDNQLKYLNSQISYSNLDIYIFTQKEYRGSNYDISFWDRLIDSFNNSMYAIVDFFFFTISVWPFIVLIIIAYIIIRKVRKRNKSR